MQKPIRLSAAAGILALLALPVAAQYPSKPIPFIAPAAAGGDADLSGRNLAQHAQKFLNNQPILVVNRPGASTAIGSMAVRTATPDGYTLLIARVASHAIVPAVDPKVPYKWNEFTMLSLLEFNPYVCAVKGDSPIKSMRELVEQMRQSPGKLNFAASGIGTIQNFGPQYLFTLAGLTKDHAVGIHYKSGGEVTTSLLGGQVQFACNNLTTLLGHFKSGALRALMVTTPQRLPRLPGTPTSPQPRRPDIGRVTGRGAPMGPPGMAKAVVDRWTQGLGKLSSDSDSLAGNARIGGIPAIRSPAETEKFVREQHALYERIATSLGIRE